MGASYGRPAPDYARSDPTTGVVQLSSAQADIPFLQMVIAEEERTGIRMPLDSLIVLARLRKERRLDVQTTAAAIQKNKSVARAVLERLVEAGLIEGRGATRGRTYTLSAQVYQRLGQGADYIRQAGLVRSSRSVSCNRAPQDASRAARPLSCVDCLSPYFFPKAQAKQHIASLHRKCGRARISQKLRTARINHRCDTTPGRTPSPHTFEGRFSRQY